MTDEKNVLINDLKEKYKIKIEKWAPNKNYYPEYMFLGGDRGILAYIYFLDNKKILTADLVKKVSRAESELDRPVFFIRNFKNLDTLFFETNDQIKNRLFYESIDKYYEPDMSSVGNYEEMISIFKKLKKDSVKFY